MCESGEHAVEPRFQREHDGRDELLIGFEKLAVDEDTVLPPKLDLLVLEGPERGQDPVHLGGREHQHAPLPLDEHVKRQDEVVGYEHGDGTC